MRDRAPQLTDEEAFGLFGLVTSLDEDNPYGNRFLKSIHDAQAIDVTLKGWWKPSSHARLPIDDELDRLLTRKTAPRINADAHKDVGIVKLGPFWGIRSHLLGICHMAPEPWVEAQAGERAQDFIEDIDDAIEATLEVWKGLSNIRVASNKSFEIDSDFHTLLHDQVEEGLDKRAPRWFRQYSIAPSSFNLDTAVNRYRADVERSITNLRNIRRIIESEYNTVKGYTEAHGSKQFWPEFFVRHLAGFWALWTDESPSRSPDSLFGSFVEASWHSLGDNLPEVSFARTLRTMGPPDTNWPLGMMFLST